MFTLNQLKEIMPSARARADLFYPYIVKHMEAQQITTINRMAAYLATIAWESGELRYTKEIWGPTEAQKGYEGRRDLGNIHPGDGYRYLGRGLIMETGRENYQRVHDELGIDCVTHPELLERPNEASLVSAWHFRRYGCNTAADIPDFRTVTKIINGGYNGWEGRKTFYAVALRVLGHPDFSNVIAGVDQ